MVTKVYEMYLAGGTVVKTLLVISPQVRHVERAEQHRREIADESPRVSLFEDTLNADVIDGSYLQSLTGGARILRKLLPTPVFQALVAFRRHRRYDVIISWDDRVAVIYALLLKLTRVRSRHLAMLTWMAPPKKGMMLKLVQKHMDRIIVWSQSHRDLLIEFFGISPAKIVLMPYLVDQHFWHPIEMPTDGICSVGNSKRDYGTLIEAMRGLPITCRIVTQVKPTQQSDVDWGLTSNGLTKLQELPDNVIFMPAGPVELRATYASARFAVIPLFPSFADNGITSILEMMAMGKAIICSRISGQIEVLEDGVNALFVPPGDPQALREAIQYLWDHPDIAASMGAEGRRRAEEIFALDHFVANVGQVLDDVLTGNRTHIATVADKLRSPRLLAASRRE
jgi:glycosyltransferase involved in cell wall biosynthesis